MSVVVGLLVACSAAAAALAVCWRTTWRAAAAWFAVATISQAAILQLIEAGPRLRYQHFPPVAILVTTHPWLVALLALQTAAVSVSVYRHVKRGRFGTVGPARAVRIVAALLLSVVTAATVSPDVFRYLSELAFAASLQVLSIATIIAMALALPRQALDAADRRLSRILGTQTNEPAASRGVPFDRFGWTVAGLAAAIAAVLSLVSYQSHPHVPDEVVYLYHARYFAEGQLAMPSPPVPAAFELDLMQYEPTYWFSPVPPGWPAVLSVGVLFGAPWLVNPALTGLCVLLAYALLGELYPRRTARYAAALLAFSPWFLFLGMSFMTHMVTLACVLLAGVGVVYARRTRHFGWGVLAGVGVGATSLVRPLDGLIVGSLIALWSLSFGGRRLSMSSLSGLLVGTVVLGGLVLPYNRALTGDPLRFPISLYTDTHYGANSNAYGFGSDRGLGWAIDPNPGHGPIDGLINANLNAFGLNTDLFGWSTGSLVFVTWLLVVGRPGRSDWLMIAVVSAFVTGYFFYYFSGGPDFGARYWFPIIVGLAALTASGIHSMERLAGARVGVVVASLTVMMLVNFLPWRAADKYRGFRGMLADIRVLATENDFDGDLVLIRGDRAPDYASAAVLNPIDISRTASATLYAWDRDPQVRRATLQTFPDRRVWIVDGPTISGSGYRVARGPVSATELLRETTSQ